MSRRRSTRLFLVAGAALVLGLAVLVSPFADSSPDGLERVAADEGFDDRAADHRLGDSPVADYGVEGVDDDRLGTALSGLAGVLVTFAVGAGVFAVIRRRGEGDGAGAGRAPVSDGTA